MAYLVLIEPDALTMNDELTAQQRHMPNCELMSWRNIHKRKDAQDCACQIDGFKEGGGIQASSLVPSCPALESSYVAEPPAATPSVDSRMDMAPGDALLPHAKAKVCSSREASLVRTMRTTIG